SATAPTATPLRHQASHVRSAASQVRRVTSFGCGAGSAMPARKLNQERHQTSSRSDDAPLRTTGIVTLMRQFIRRYLLGERRRIAGRVYGTIVVLSVLAAGAHSYAHHLWRLASIAAISALVLWIAHVYSHGLGESVAAGRRLDMAEIREIAGREYSIVL